ncbi:DUF2569 family protein [Bartonella sp. HY038]|uniref:DUF2569 family protein n=1 Tax=Bartonella sp. HY038 TaxID=2759660 RepID=UPI0015FCA7C0|nr:DUF2569 family protein [Bartonella sp. HY038]
MNGINTSSNITAKKGKIVKNTKIGGALYLVALYLSLFTISCIRDIIAIFNSDFSTYFFNAAFSNNFVVAKLLNTSFLFPLFLFQFVMLFIIAIGYFKKYYYFPTMFILFLISNFLYNAAYIKQIPNFEYLNYFLNFILRFF